MPSLADLSRLFSAFSGVEILVGLAITAAILIIIPDWRLSLLALEVQYFLVAVLFATIIPLQVATVRMIAGALVAVILYITARRVQGRPARGEGIAGWKIERRVFVVRAPFRVLGVTLIAVSVITISVQINFLNAPILFWLAALWLLSVGLLIIVLTRDALKLGMGLLTFTSGFGILYLAIDPSLLIYGLIVLSDLLIGLAIAHLASAPTLGIARRRGEG